MKGHAVEWVHTSNDSNYDHSALSHLIGFFDGQQNVKSHLPKQRANVFRWVYNFTKTE